MTFQSIFGKETDISTDNSWLSLTTRAFDTMLYRVLFKSDFLDCTGDNDGASGDGDCDP